MGKADHIGIRRDARQRQRRIGAAGVDIAEAGKIKRAMRGGDHDMGIFQHGNAGTAQAGGNAPRISPI